MADEEVAEIIGVLEDCAERLADAALSALRSALEAGETARPDAERRYTRARAAIVRAVAVLAGSAARDEEAD